MPMKPKKSNVESIPQALIDDMDKATMSIATAIDKGYDRHGEHHNWDILYNGYNEALSIIHPHTNTIQSTSEKSYAKLLEIQGLISAETESEELYEQLVETAKTLQKIKRVRLTLDTPKLDDAPKFVGNTPKVSIERVDSKGNITLTEIKIEEEYSQQDIYTVEDKLRELQNFTEDKFRFDTDGMSQIEGLLSFSKEKPLILSVISYCSFLYNNGGQTRLRQVSPIELHRLSPVLEKTITLFNKIISLRPSAIENEAEEEGFSGDKKSQYIRRYKDEMDRELFLVHDAIKTIVAPVVAMVNVQATHDNHNRIDEIATGFNKYQDNQSADAVEKQSNHFATAATTYAEKSRLWLGIVLLLTLVFTYMLFSNPELFAIDKGIETFTPAVISAFSTKVFLLLVASSLLFWGLRQYNIMKHHEFTNSQKEVMLKTVRDVSDSASTMDDVRKEIIRKATDSMFTIQPTGFISHKHSENNTGSIGEALDLIKRVKDVAQ